MKKPEEIKKGLSMCTHGADCGQCPYTLLECSHHQMEQDALDYIQKLEAQVPKWISVEDQPEPPEDDVYWCYGYWIGSGRRQAETAEYLCGEWKIANNFVLTHWMPLPEPPKEDAHG